MISVGGAKIAQAEREVDSLAEFGQRSGKQNEQEASEMMSAGPVRLPHPSIPLSVCARPPLCLWPINSTTTLISPFLSQRNSSPSPLPRPVQTQMSLLSVDEPSSPDSR